MMIYSENDDYLMDDFEFLLIFFLVSFSSIFVDYPEFQHESYKHLEIILFKYQV